MVRTHFRIIRGNKVFTVYSGDPCCSLLRPLILRVPKCSWNCGNLSGSDLFLQPWATQLCGILVALMVILVTKSAVSCRMEATLSLHVYGVHEWIAWCTKWAGTIHLMIPCWTNTGVLGCISLQGLTLELYDTLPSCGQRWYWYIEWL